MMILFMIYRCLGCKENVNSLLMEAFKRLFY